MNLITVMLDLLSNKLKQLELEIKSDLDNFHLINNIEDVEKKLNAMSNIVFFSTQIVEKRNKVKLIKSQMNLLTNSEYTSIFEGDEIYL